MERDFYRPNVHWWSVTSIDQMSFTLQPTLSMSKYVSICLLAYLLVALFYFCLLYLLRIIDKTLTVTVRVVWRERGVNARACSASETVVSVLSCFWHTLLLLLALCTGNTAINSPVTHCQHSTAVSYTLGTYRHLMNKWMNEWMSLCSPLLIETYREGAVCPSYACLYSSVLSLLQKRETSAQLAVRNNAKCVMPQIVPTFPLNVWNLTLMSYPVTSCSHRPIGDLGLILKMLMMYV